MKIAIVGCTHGKIETIYETIASIEQQKGIKVELLLCCGDFIATRNLNDLECWAGQPHKKTMGTFYKYYNGEKKAPILTIVIGGNHEASNYFQELPFGGWIAENIYYLGYAGVVNYKGRRIGGISGIYNYHDYLKGHFEYSPYDGNTLRSVYHLRKQDIIRFNQLPGTIDIMMSHDWPTNVYRYGNVRQLVEERPGLRSDIEKNRLGSPPLFKILMNLKPRRWCAAHLHVKYSSTIPHRDVSQTQFVVLDECLPDREFLDIIDIPPRTGRTATLNYDLEWLNILRKTNELTRVNSAKTKMSNNNSVYRGFNPTVEDKQLIFERFGRHLVIPNNFERTAVPYRGAGNPSNVHQPNPVENAQTVEFCRKLNIDDPLRLLSCFDQ